MQALLALGADAMFLQRWLLWAPGAPRLGVSGAREWEGSMLARRASVPPYPALARGEDTAVMHAMLRRGRVLLLDAPWAYTYVQTGANTWAAEHFAAIWAAASFEQAPTGYETALAALGAHGPHAAYAAALATAPRADRPN